MDSNFSSIVVDSLIPVNDSQVNTSLVVGPLEKRTTYYWRLAWQSRDYAQSEWTRTWRFTTAGASIRGLVFNDLNRNGKRTLNEPILSNWPLLLSGKIKGIIRTDSLGRYSIDGIDSGLYIIKDPTDQAWSHSIPDSGTYQLTVGLSDSLTGRDFGRYFLWNSISGRVFNDFNEDGKFDSSSDEPLQFWSIDLTGSKTSIRSSDANGLYSFSKLEIGVYTVALDLSLETQWEQISPQVGSGYTLAFNGYDQHLADVDFAVHRIPDRVKVYLTVHDSTDGSTTHSKTVRFGIRTGASFGIWDVDSGTTNIDFSEGEFEIPPPTSGFFDARFVNPHGGTSYFGVGSWTDMRPFTSSSQVDTFKLSFAPGSLAGEDYPMTICWSKAYVARSFNGSVVIVDKYASEIDMHTSDSMVIRDPGVTSILIIAQSPMPHTDAVRESPKTVPREYWLGQNYPNPFNPMTDIRYSLPDVRHVSLKVYDVLGREVVTLVNEVKPPGEYTVSWNARTNPSGVYFYRLATGSFNQTRKLILLK